jgi:hypothetical protein
LVIYFFLGGAWVAIWEMESSLPIRIGIALTGLALAGWIAKEEWKWRKGMRFVVRSQRIREDESRFDQ